MKLVGVLAVVLALMGTGSARADVLGDDAGACTSGKGPAIRVAVTGVKDRTGRFKLELYPATQEDFLKDDRDLKAQGKFFRRIWADPPASGPVIMCIRAPRPGRYALLFVHDRDDKNKFNFWKDGAAFPANTKLGRSKPRLDQALIDVGPGITTVTVKAQYLRGLGGFAPLD